MDATFNVSEGETEVMSTWNTEYILNLVCWPFNIYFKPTEEKRTFFIVAFLRPYFKHDARSIIHIQAKVIYSCTLNIYLYLLIIFSHTFICKKSL